MTTIHAHGGLVNRLRAIISYREVCGPITVAWKPDGQVNNERFTDVFKPLPGVEFISTVPTGAISTYEPHPKASGGWGRGYLDLKPIHPTPPIEGRYSAIHVRRTDAVAYQLEMNAFEDLDAWLDWLRPIQWAPVFIATDNGTTQRELVAGVQEMGKVPLWHGDIAEHDSQDLPEVRNTSLRRAWWDLETCVAATSFRGSGASSYTDLIETLRRMR